MKYYLIFNCIQCYDIKKVEVSAKDFQKSTRSSRTVGDECLKDVYDYCERCEAKGVKQTSTCCGGIKVKKDERCPVCGDLMD